MQSIINLTKFLVFAILSCSLLIIDWDGGETSIPALVDNPQRVAESGQTHINESVWNTMGHEFKLDHQTQSSQVQAQIRKLVADQAEFYRILEQAAPYIYFIHQQTQARGLPAELALIPFIESEFNPNDRSNKGAAGLWQLMSGTARELGVKVKSGYDGRRNIIASTNAALAYFKDLGNTFNGDWYLAIAAYDCGQVKVASTERRTGIHSFWNLPLPKETRYYVPKLLAVAAIIENPKKYGVQLPPINNQPYFTQLEVQKSVKLKQLAKSSGVNVETLHTLNPDYSHGVVPKKADLLIPIDKAKAINSLKG